VPFQHPFFTPYILPHSLQKTARVGKRKKIENREICRIWHVVQLRFRVYETGGFGAQRFPTSQQWPLDIYKLTFFKKINYIICWNLLEYVGTCWNVGMLETQNAGHMGF
jgi:hypothetical protein